MGFVLTGGKSTRMGTNKAFLEFRGRTLLDRALEVVRWVCPEPRIVGDAAMLARYSNVIGDVYPGCGPLGGIHAALRSTSAELNFTLAVDMPFVSRDLLSFLGSIAENTDAVVTVPRTSRGFQPLCAVYRRAFTPVAEQALREGKYKIDALYSQVELRIIDAKELSVAGFDERNFFNVNTPEELRVALDVPNTESST